MSANTDLINTFYTSFQRRDYLGMVACYHPDIEFTDSVFRNLKGKYARAMWQMLAERSTDLTLIYDSVQADDQTGSAHWEARYTYSSTGRKVLNKIDAHFRFADGKIIVHHDSFNLWRWASQALGISGVLLGWTPFMQKTIQTRAKETLDQYMKKNGL